MASASGVFTGQVTSVSWSGPVLGCRAPSFPGPELPMGDGVMHPSDRAMGTAAWGLAASSGGFAAGGLDCEGL